MKKTLLIALVLAAVAGLAFAGVVYAKGPQPAAPGMGYGPMMAQGQIGPLHTNMVEAFAAKFGLTVDEINTRLAAGERMYDIALSAGVAADEFPALMQEVRNQAISAALADGVITQDQADWMLSHAFGRGGFGQGVGACSGTGIPVGTGGMHGWRWAPANP
jgi:hypothetical protein